MIDMGADRLETVAEYSDRGLARADERVMELENPGPLKRTPWAGKGSAALGPLKMAIVMRDPVAAGQEFGNAIDPSVEAGRKDFNAFARTRWLDEEDVALIPV